MNLTAFSPRGLAGPTSPAGGGGLAPKQYPFVVDSPHSRWGIHSWCRNEAWMLRHQRGTVDVCMNPTAMRKKGIKDGDMVKVFNAHGEFYAMAKTWPALPDSVIFTAT